MLPHLATLFDEVPFGVAAFDGDLRCVGVNQALASIRRVPADKLAGQHAADVFPAATGRLLRHLRAVVETGERFAGLEIRWPADAAGERTGRQRCFSLSGYPARDATGTVVGVTVTATEIEERAAEPTPFVAPAEQQQALRELERYRLLADCSRDLILFVGLDGTIIDANPAALVAYGYTHDELIGRTIFDLRGGELTPAMHDNVAESSWQGITFDTVFHRQDGSTFPAEVSVVRAELHGDAVLMSVARDLTERQRAEAALRENEQDLSMAIETARLGTWSLDLQTGEFRGSQRAREIYGLQGDDHLTMRSLAALVHPEDRAVVAEAATQTARNGEIYEKRYRIIRPDGEVRWIVVSGRTIPGDDGEPARSVGVSMDVTERYAAELALREREEMLASILAASPDLITVSDVNGVTRTVSPAMEEVLGFTADERVGHGLTDRVHPDDMARVKAAARQAFISGEVSRVRHRYQHRDGRWRVLDSWGRAVHEPDGTPRHLVAISRDVTAAVEAEEERTRLLEAERAARTEAEEASHAKSAFLAMMSHEIRTPLNGVIGMTSLLLDGRLDADQREYAATIRSSGEALLQIINDILDFSKIEAGRIELERAACDPRAIVEDVMTLLAGQAADKQIELAAVVDIPDAACYLGDAGRVRQILLNLVGNALKFTGADGAVTIRAGIVEVGDVDGHALIRFEVCDTGIGIPAHVVPRLFQPFEQADGSTSRRYGGTGLGLAISKRLATMLGGEIGVTSVAGRGSTFWFTVCLDRDRAAEDVLVAPRSLRGRRVLVVSDSAVGRQTLGQQLAAWGVTVATAEYGEAANTVVPSGDADAAPFDLAIVDLATAPDDGHKAVRTLRSHPGFAARPLLVVVPPGQRPDPEGIGDDDAFLTRPVRPSHLRDGLTALLLGAVAGRAVVADLTDGRDGIDAPTQDGARVLVAEDNVVNQKVAGRMLEKMGYRVDVVANGQEALAALRQVPYAAVLMDCQMPEMDGFEATAHIRAAEDSTRHTTIIAMTASAMLGDREQCLAAGMDDYVSKPVRQDDLATVLRRWITPGRHRRG